jgi:short-subunit dehydrogenase involved in D-alanine esterification of teichoic acids
MSKVIVVTGGSDGLGKTLTEHLAKDNKVIILATNENKMKTIAANNNCDYFVCDVSSYYEVEEVINNILDKYNKIDVLINSAGLWIQEELEQNEPDRI